MKKWNRRNFMKKLALGGFLFSGPGTSWAQSHGSSASLPDENASKNILDLPYENDASLATKSWPDIRRAFNISEDQMSQFNTASFGPPSRFVMNRMHKIQTKTVTNGYPHPKFIRAARTAIGDLLGIQQEDFAVIRNATEGINLVANELNLKKGDEVILTTHEHVGGASPWLALKKRIGIEIKLVEPDLTGKENFNRMLAAFSKKTRVLAISHITCTTGMILPVKELIAECKKRNIISCIDGAQALGMIPVRLNELQPDFYIASCHKWCFANGGTGFMYVNERIREQLEPLFYGAYVDESYNLLEKSVKARTSAERYEYGTRNTLNIIGLHEALKFQYNIGPDRIHKRGQELCGKIRKNIKSNSGIEILTPEDPQFHGSILTFRFTSKENNEPAYYALLKKKIRVRYIYENNLDALRISCSMLISEEDVSELIEAINSIN